MLQRNHKHLRTDEEAYWPLTLKRPIACKGYFNKHFNINLWSATVLQKIKPDSRSEHDSKINTLQLHCRMISGIRQHRVQLCPVRYSRYVQCKANYVFAKKWGQCPKMHCSRTLWHHPYNLMWFGLRPHGFGTSPREQRRLINITSAQRNENSCKHSNVIINNIILWLISLDFFPFLFVLLTDFSRARCRTALQLQSELINNYLRRHTSTDSGCSSRPAVAVETTAAVLRAEIGR